MPIKEESFRIGSGRYLQGAGYAARLGDEVLRLGKCPLVIGGARALEIAGEAVRSSLEQKCKKYEIITHRGTCSEEAAVSYAEQALTEGFDLIVGVGGGVVCDLAKLVAYHGGLPVINLPTSSATCAAYTPLSVRYTEEGRTVGSRHYEREVDCVIADTALISTQPPRLLLSGVFDAIAKLVEIKQRYSEGEDCPLGLDYAYAMSKRTYSTLTKDIRSCIVDMAGGRVTKTVERVVFAAIAATGVISGISRGSNQTALAHKFYEMTRTLYPEISRPYLHGEIVGVGLILQNHYNGEEGNNRELISLMKEYKMPHSVRGLGIEGTMEKMEEYYRLLLSSSAMENTDARDAERLRLALEYLWRIE